MNTPHDLHPAVRDARLTDRLDELRTALAAVQAPGPLEAGLVDEFRVLAARRRRAGRPRLWWMPPLAMVATVAVVGWMVRNPALQPAAPPAPGPAAGEAAADDAGPFLALKSLERIALEPQATVVTTEFPRALLAQWGLPVAPERAAEPVRAEMLYSAEGEPLALRLLN
ncbi:MAG: hypothetical protein NDI88_00810 [Lysobacter sp.]|nr:hypothetical protein [Lysobacter sp.]